MLQRFQDFVTGITQCYRSIQKIKSTEMTEFGLKGTHVMCLFFLGQNILWGFAGYVETFLTDVGISAAAAAMPWPCTVPTPERVFM